LAEAFRTAQVFLALDTATRTQTCAGRSPFPYEASARPRGTGRLTLSSRDRHRGGGHPPTPATPPCVRVRTRRFETVTLHSSTKVGGPRDLKYALESPTVRALVRAIGQGPRPLLAVLRARRGETPSFKRAARRRRGVFHCRHRAARSRNRTQRVR